MPTTYRATLTNVGAALVADAIAQGTTLTWAKMALGDGNGSTVIVDAGRTSLVNERYRAPLNDLGRDSANPNTIVGTLVVPPETGGWTIREFGIYDNASTPRLVAYGETPEIEKPASSAGTGINLRLRFKLAVSADANITLSPDSNEAYATIEYVKDNAVKSLSVSGRTITYTMGDGDTHTIRTQDTTYSVATQSANGLMSATDKTTLDNVAETYVKKAGDTMSGTLNTKKIVLDNSTLAAKTAYNDGSSRTYQSDILQTGTTNTNFGQHVLLGGGSGTIIAGGESGINQLADIVGTDNEQVMIVADTYMNFKVHCNTWSEARTMIFHENGNLSVPGNVSANGVVLTNYTHPSYTAYTGKPTANATPGFGETFTVSQINSDVKGHVTGVTDRTIKIPAINATQSAAGLMSAEDKTKLDNVPSEYVKKSGDTITGNLNAQKIVLIDSPLAAKTSYNNGSNSTYQSDILQTGTTNTNLGQHVLLGGRSGTIIAGGEAGLAQLAEIVGNDSEQVYIVADTLINFKVHCNTWSEARTMTFYESGNLSVPGTVSSNGEVLKNATVMTGASSSTNGTAGLVPAPPKNSHLYFLRGDATWKNVLEVADSLLPANFESDGYLKFESGLLLMWGMTGSSTNTIAPNSSTTVTITFPVPFIGAGYYSLLAIVNGAINFNATRIDRGDGSYATIAIYNQSSQSVNGRSVIWWALGRWK